MKEPSFYQKARPLIISFVAVLVIYLISAQKTGYVVYDESEKLITNPGSEKELMKFLNSSSYKIDISIYVLTNPRIIRLLNELANRGIEIRIVLDEDIKENYQTEKNLSKLIKIKFGKESKNITSYHAKYVIIDDKCAWIGSMNWNIWGLNTNREIAIITCNSNIVSKLSTIFENDWMISSEYHER